MGKTSFTKIQVLEKFTELKDLLRELQDEIVEEDRDFQKQQPQPDALTKVEAEYVSAVAAVKKHNDAGTQESAEGLEATQELLKLASLRRRARKEAGLGLE